MVSVIIKMGINILVVGKMENRTGKVPFFTGVAAFICAHLRKHWCGKILILIVASSFAEMLRSKVLRSWSVVNEGDRVEMMPL